MNSDILSLTRQGVKERLTLDLDEIEGVINQTSFDSEKIESLNQKVSEYRDRIDTTNYPESLEDFKAIIPLNPLHADIIKLHSEVLKEKEFDELTLWKCNRFKRLDKFEIPSYNVPLELNIECMKGEIRSDIFNLTNGSDKAVAITFEVEIQGINDMTVFQVEYVDTRELVVQATALVELTPQGNVFSTLIPAGMTRQIWLRFNTTNLSAGIHSGMIKITKEGATPKSIPISLTVKTNTIPNDIGMNAGVWDYAYTNHNSINPDNYQKSIQEMNSHFVDIIWGKRAILPFPSANDYDDNWNLINELDFSDMKAWIASRPNASFYMIYATITEASTFAGLTRDSDNFKVAVKNWAKALQDEIPELGLGVGQKIGIDLIDEPHTVNQFEALNNWTQPFKEGAPEILIYMNPQLRNILQQSSPAKENIWAAMLESLNYCDILCPKQSDPIDLMPYQMDQTINKFNMSPNKFLWFYSCGGSVRHFSPSYFTLQPWIGSFYKGSASNFWSFSDGRFASGWDSWNEYPGSPNYIQDQEKTTYSPVFFGDTSITNSKHWEAFREGLYNFYYYKKLEEKDGITPLTQSIQLDFFQLYYEFFHRYHYYWGSHTFDNYADQLRSFILSEISETTPNLTIATVEENHVFLDITDERFFPVLTDINELIIDWGDGLSNKYQFDAAADNRKAYSDILGTLKHRYQSSGIFTIRIYYHKTNYHHNIPVSLHSIDFKRRLPMSYKSVILD